MAGMTTISDPYGGDPLIYDIGDGADLNVQGGQPRMSSGLENAAYLSLFVDANWWGNDIDPANPGATGSTHFLPLLDGLKLTPSALDDLEAAAALDLAWMTDDGVVKSVDVSASITGIGSVGLELTFTEPDGGTTSVRWKLNWTRIAEEAS
jgi:phage gp46-like protein